MEARRALTAVRKGDLVALVAPAGPVSPERVRGARQALESRGLHVRIRDDITSCHRYLAGSDERRAEELLSALLDPDVKAVFLARGGYGAQRLISTLSEVRTARPKPVVGFSDNTVLLNYLRRAFGWPTLHGPHPQIERTEELDSVLDCLGYMGARVCPEFSGLRALNREPNGAVEGEVAGGCLSLIVSSIGTPYQISFQDRIVFLEDIGEPAYRIDRMLHHLRTSGSLDQALALVFGKPENFIPRDEQAELGHLEGLLVEFAGSVPFPVLCGLPCGHTEPNRPLPFGPRARLDPAAGTLRFLEGLVEEADE